MATTSTRGIAGLGSLEQYIPGITGNTQQASSNITSQLGGLPSASQARTKAAYFGATSGLPNSGVSSALGYDLYNQDAQRYQQQGFDNLMKMLTGYHSTVGQDQQFNQNLEFEQSQATEANRRADAELRMRQREQSKKFAPRYESSGEIGPDGKFTTDIGRGGGGFAKGFERWVDPVTSQVIKWGR